MNKHYLMSSKNIHKKLINVKYGNPIWQKMNMWYFKAKLIYNFIFLAVFTFFISNAFGQNISNDQARNETYSTAEQYAYSLLKAISNNSIADFKFVLEKSDIRNLKVEKIDLEEWEKSFQNGLKFIEWEIERANESGIEIGIDWSNIIFIGVEYDEKDEREMNGTLRVVEGEIFFRSNSRLYKLPFGALPLKTNEWRHMDLDGINLAKN